MRKQYLKALVLALALIWCGLFLLQKIDLTTADLGRHLVNGRILLEAPFEEKFSLLRTNFYSYTMPEQSFVNHHWLSGVIFELVARVGGFSGLSAFYVGLYLMAVLSYWNIGRRVSNFYIASLVLVLLAPIIASRAEVRPEVWSYLLGGALFNLLYYRKYLWVVPVIMLFWVNLHIGFVFGFLIIAGFAAEDIFKGRGHRKMGIIFATAVLAALINPYGYKLLIYPLAIFKDYGYTIVENQSVRLLENLGFVEGMNFALFKLLLASVVAGAAFMFIKKRGELSPALIVPSLVSGAMAYLAIRNFPVFGLFSLPFLSYLLSRLYAYIGKEDAPALASIMLLVGTLTFQVEEIQGLKPRLGLGLTDGVNSAVEFYKANSLSGPIFNNYDIGGYLIYHLYPDEKVFVDNRPEAYTGLFFDQEYKSPQQDGLKWLELERKYGFNAIIFSHRDYTPWGQEFLLSRARDESWAPVYLDNYLIIFLKRNEFNAGLIKKFELEPGAFGLSVGK